MKRLYFLLGLCCFLAVVYGKAPMSLLNGGFESGLRGWTSDSRGMTLFVESAAHSGEMGIRIVDEDPERGSELRSVRLPARAGRGYEVSFMGRTSGNSRGVGFYLVFYDRDGVCLTTSSRYGEQLHCFGMTKEWKRYAYVGIAPPGTASLSIRVHSLRRHRSCVDIDDFTLYEYDAEESRKVASSRQRLSPFARRKRLLEVAMLSVPYDDVSRAVQVVEVSIHPRLFASAPEFAALRHHVEETDGIHRLMYGRLEYLAKSLLSVPPVSRVLEGRRLLSVSRVALYRISTLALCYRLSGHAAYRDRCLEEMRAVASFSDWNPSHFLDVGEMTLALATGYDWLYDELSESDRKLFSGAILSKGLRSSGKESFWRMATNNWGQVCHTGMLAGALAVAELDPALCRRQIYESICALRLPMGAYAPHGSYPEGPGYWEYGTGFNVLGLSMLFHALGTDYGLSELPGFRETSLYREYMTGPTGYAFNYADGGMGRRGSQGTLWWFAHHFELDQLVEHGERAWFESLCRDRRPLRATANNGWFFPYSFFWIFDRMGESSSTSLPLVWHGGGSVPVGVMRSGWEPDSVYVGLKGGSPGAPHGHMDAGSFILEAGKVRWLIDLGAEGYHRIESMGLDLWNRGQDSDRWKLYRLSNRSHNTLVLDGQLQRVSGNASIVSLVDGAVKTGVMDLTSVYADRCSSARRTITLDAAGAVQVQDELCGLRPGTEVLWGVGTREKVASVSGQRVVLRHGDREFTLESVDAPVSWQVVDARIPQPAFKGDSENPNFKRLELKMPAPEDGKLVIRVRMQLTK